MSRVLVVADSMSQWEELQRHISAQRADSPDTRFLYPAGITHDRAHHEALVHDCKQVIAEEDVDTVICLNSQNHLLHAVLLKEFEHMKGPSFESVLLCMNKHYCRKLLLGGFNLAFEGIEVEEATSADYALALEEIGEPAVVMDAFGTTKSFKHAYGSDISDTDIKTIHDAVVDNHSYWKSLLEGHINSQKHPLLFEPMALVVEPWQAYEGDITFHQVECCIQDEELIPWAITDLILTTGKRRCLKYVSMPSTLKENSQHEIWGTVGVISQKLMKYGFNNQFFNLLVICTKDGGVRVVDLECGIIAQNTALYKHVLNHGNNLKACIKLGMGNIVREPKHNPQRHSIRAELRTFSESATIADQVIDIKVAKQDHDVELLVHHLDTPIQKDTVDGGMHLANVYADGKDLETCIQSVQRAMAEFVKPKNKMNWKISEAAQQN